MAAVHPLIWLLFPWFPLPLPDEHPELPAIYHLARFPDPKTAIEQWSRWSTHREWLRKVPRQALSYHSRVQWERWVETADDSYAAWNSLDNAHRAAKAGLTLKARQELECVRRVLGEERWDRGEMPGRLPVCHYP